MIIKNYIIFYLFQCRFSREVQPPFLKKGGGAYIIVLTNRLMEWNLDFKQLGHCMYRRFVVGLSISGEIIPGWCAMSNPSSFNILT
jgi:hypothetical protein